MYIGVIYISITQQMTLVYGNDLYLGGVADVNLDFLQSHNIQIIINVARECNYDLTSLPNIRYYHYDVDDSDFDIYVYFDPIIQIIKNKSPSDAVLIHCYAGVSRSATIVLAYLMSEHHLSLFDGLGYLVTKRHVKPNPHFMEQLMIYERNILGTCSYISYMDDYAASFIVQGLQLNPSDVGIVKWIYVSENRDIWKTMDMLGSPYV